MVPACHVMTWYIYIFLPWFQLCCNCYYSIVEILNFRKTGLIFVAAEVAG
jgi:hypothetical protein